MCLSVCLCVCVSVANFFPTCLTARIWNLCRIKAPYESQKPIEYHSDPTNSFPIHRSKFTTPILKLMGVILPNNSKTVTIKSIFVMTLTLTLSDLERSNFQFSFLMFKSSSFNAGMLKSRFEWNYTVFEDLTVDLKRSNNALIAIISKTMTDTDLACIVHI